MGDGEVGRPREFGTDDIAAFDAQLDAFVRGFADVGVTAGVARRRSGLHREQQVARLGDIAFGRNHQAVVEERQIERRVVEVGLFPRQVGTGQTAAVVGARLHAVEQIAARGAGHGRQRTVGRDGVVTRASGAQAERQLVDPAYVLQEILLGGVPFEGHRGEEAPLVVGGEVRRTVVTPRYGEVVALFVVVVEAGQQRHFRPLGQARGGRIGLLVGHGVHVVPQHVVVHVALSAQREVVALVAVGGETGQRVDVVAAFGFELVAEGVFARKAEFVEFGAVGLTAFTLVLGGKRSRIVAVGVALERIVGVLAAQLQAFGQRYFEIGRVVERGPLDGVGVLVDRRTRRIDTLAVAPKRVVVLLRVDVGRKIHGCAVVGRAADFGEVLGVVAPCIAAAVADLQPFEQLVVEIQTSRDALHTAVVDDTLRIVVTQRGVVAALFRAARNRERIVLVGRRAGDFVDPVGSLAQ